MRTAPHANPSKQYVTVTHPFHPWHGRRFELIDCRRGWGQWRVHVLTEQGAVASLPAAWTDLGPKDPFVEQAHGRAIARLTDLLELAQMVEAGVKENKPNM